MKKYNLFLDDIRMPKECTWLDTDIYKTLNWEIVRSYNEFTSHIREKYKLGYFPKIISFDHDLADSHYGNAISGKNQHSQENTGYSAAKWVVDFCQSNKLKLPIYFVHSMNPIGKQNIQRYLNNYNNYNKFI